MKPPSSLSNACLHTAAAHDLIFAHSVLSVAIGSERKKEFHLLLMLINSSS